MTGFRLGLCRVRDTAAARLRSRWPEATIGDVMKDLSILYTRDF